MARKFSELRAKMSPASQAGSERLAAAMLAVMDLAEPGRQAMAGTRKPPSKGVPFMSRKGV